MIFACDCPAQSDLYSVWSAINFFDYLIGVGIRERINAKKRSNFPVSNIWKFCVSKSFETSTYFIQMSTSAGGISKKGVS